eukprot:gene9062-10001_t
MLDKSVPSETENTDRKMAKFFDIYFLGLTIVIGGQIISWNEANYKRRAAGGNSIRAVLGPFVYALVKSSSRRRASISFQSGLSSSKDNAKSEPRSTVQSRSLRFVSSVSIHVEEQVTNIVEDIDDGFGHDFDQTASMQPISDVP